MRLVTWNTLWRFGPWEERQALLESELRAQSPDVVLLQETWPSQANALAAAAGLSVLGFGGGHFDSKLSNVPTDERFGNAILASSGELLSDDPFDGPGDPAPRCLLVADVGGRVIATTHLTHMSEAGPVRADQLRLIVARLRNLDGQRPFLLAGDCNLVPSSPEYQVARGLGLTDVWSELRPGEHGATMVPANPEIHGTSWMDDRNGSTAPKGTGVRLDYVWSSGDIEIRTIDRFGAVEGPRWPSDHLGLTLDVD